MIIRKTIIFMATLLGWIAAMWFWINPPEGDTVISEEEDKVDGEEN